MLLLGGGDALVRGAAGIARGFGISPMVVGLTVVAFGTSAPELVVNLIAAVRGSSGISFGNVIGSNFANIGLVLGVAALVSPLTVKGEVIAREIPFMVLATVATVIVVLDVPLRGTTAVIDRSDGLILLVLFTVFLYAAVREVLRQRAQDDALLEEAKDVTLGTRPSTTVQVLLVVGGLAGLVVGGQLLVGSAIALAMAAGVSETVIGLTVVAIGTSAPELATTLLAVRRGETDIAVGNVVGSNLFNLLLVLALTAIVKPVDVPAGGTIDLAFLLFASVVLLPFAMTGQRRVSRLEGSFLLALWGGYSVWRVLQ